METKMVSVKESYLLALEHVVVASTAYIVMMIREGSGKVYPEEEVDRITRQFIEALADVGRERGE